MNRFLRPPINIQMNLLFSRQSCDLDHLVNVIRSSRIQKQREKCSNVQIFTGATFPHPGTRVNYYIRENPANVAINTENTMAALLARLAINIIRTISIIAVLRRIKLCGVSHPAADISSENKKDGIIPSCEVGITYEDFEACI